MENERRNIMQKRENIEKKLIEESDIIKFYIVKVW